MPIMPSSMPRWLLCGAVLALGCDPGEPCPDSPDCPPGARCRCDDAGRLLLVDGDEDGDGTDDRVRYERNAAGRVTTVKTDLVRNGTVDRLQEYTYDEAGRRVAYRGWLVKCAGEKFHWRCDYEEPCPAPYEQCAPCRKKYVIEKEDGSRQPIGELPVGVE